MGTFYEQLTSLEYIVIFYAIISLLVNICSLLGSGVVGTVFPILTMDVS